MNETTKLDSNEAPPNALHNALFVVESRIRMIELGLDKMWEKQGNIERELENFGGALQRLSSKINELEFNLSDCLRFVNAQKVDMIFRNLEKSIKKKK